MKIDTAINSYKVFFKAKPKTTFFVSAFCLVIIFNIYHFLFTSKDVKILEELSANSVQEAHDVENDYKFAGKIRMNREEEAESAKHKKELADFKTKYVGYKIENLSCEYRGIKQDSIDGNYPFHCYPGVGDGHENGVVWIGVQISPENARQLGSVYPGDKFKVWGTIQKLSYALENIQIKLGGEKVIASGGQAEALLTDGWVKGKDMSGPNSKKEIAVSQPAAPAPTAEPSPNIEATSTPFESKNGDVELKCNFISASNNGNMTGEGIVTFRDKENKVFWIRKEVSNVNIDDKLGGISGELQNGEVSFSAVPDKKMGILKVVIQNRKSNIQLNWSCPMPAPVVAAAPAPAVDNSPFAPSFDCAKASNSMEKMICGDRQLSALDVKLSQTYSKALSTAQDKQKLKSEQITWIKQARTCADVACLKQSLQQRISQL